MEDKHSFAASGCQATPVPRSGGKGSRPRDTGAESRTAQIVPALRPSRHRGREIGRSRIDGRDAASEPYEQSRTLNKSVPVLSLHMRKPTCSSPPVTSPLPKKIDTVPSFSSSS